MNLILFCSEICRLISSFFVFCLEFEFVFDKEFWNGKYWALLHGQQGWTKLKWVVAKDWQASPWSVDRSNICSHEWTDELHYCEESIRYNDQEW